MINYRRRRGVRAFSLVEVVLALGICAFVLVTIMGLYGLGLQVNRESESQIQAANLVTGIITARRAAPLGNNTTYAPIPVRAMTNLFGPAYANGTQLTTYLARDGQVTNQANAVYLASCRAGTNAFTGPNIAQVYLRLSWPAAGNVAAPPPSRYEVTTCIPFR